MNALRRRAASTAAIGLALAGSAAALAVTAAGPASASTASSTNNEGVQYCQSIATLGPGNIMGPCVAYYESHDHNTAATGVYECQNTLVPQGTFANVGTCVSFLNNFKGT